MTRHRLTRPLVAAQAVTLVDRDGFGALSLSALAQELHVGPSALYTHVNGLEGLQYLVAVTATDNLANLLRSAAIGTTGAMALAQMGSAYRRFALDHPGQFASTLLPPKTDDDDLAGANEALLNVFVLVFAAAGLGPTESYLAARSARSALHGFLALEHVSGTSATHDDEYRHLLATLSRGLIPLAVPNRDDRGPH